jgi:dynein assembly factor 1
MPNLGVLNLQKNPVVGKMEHYRKQVIASIPTLKYLDERPIFPDERRAALAWY